MNRSKLLIMCVFSCQVLVSILVLVDESFEAFFAVLAEGEDLLVSILVLVDESFEVLMRAGALSSVLVSILVLVDESFEGQTIRHHRHRGIGFNPCSRG